MNFYLLVSGIALLILIIVLTGEKFHHFNTCSKIADPDGTTVPTEPPQDETTHLYSSSPELPRIIEKFTLKLNHCMSDLPEETDKVSLSTSCTWKKSLQTVKCGLH